MSLQPSQVGSQIFQFLQNLITLFSYFYFHILIFEFLHYLITFFRILIYFPLPSLGKCPSSHRKSALKSSRTFMTNAPPACQGCLCHGQGDVGPFILLRDNHVFVCSSFFFSQPRVSVASLGENQHAQDVIASQICQVRRIAPC